MYFCFFVFDFIAGKMGLIGEQIVMNPTTVITIQIAALRPFTHDRTSKTLNARDMIRTQPVSIHKVLHTHEQKNEADRTSSFATAWTSL